jgi:hypothetical protein
MISVFIRKMTREPTSHLGKAMSGCTEKEDKDIYKLGRKPSPETKFASTLIMDF